MKLLHTDREPEEIKKDLEKVIDKIEDHTDKQETVKQKDNNTWIWLLIAALVIATIFYLKNLKDKQNEEIE